MGAEDEATPTQSELIAAVAQLNVTVAALSHTVEQYTGLLQENTAYLKRKVRLLEQADRRRKVAIRVAFATIAADLIVTIIGLVVLHAQAETSHKIRETLRANYVTQQQQAETRFKVLCPLYSFVLSLAKPDVRASLPPDQQKIFDEEIRVFHDGYITLKCTPPLPATSSPTQ